MQTMIEHPDTTALRPVVLGIEDQAIAMAEVGSAECYETAIAFLKRIKTIKKQIEDAFAPAVKAAHAAHKEMTTLRGKFTKPLDECEHLVKAGVSTYTREQELARREEEARLRALELKKEEDRRLREASALEDAGELEAAAAVIEAPMVAPAVIAPRAVPKVEGGSTRAVWKHEVVNAFSVPREFCIPDQQKIAAYAKRMGSAANVPGVRFYEDAVVSVRMTG